jgi:hypothetical protein
VDAARGVALLGMMAVHTLVADDADGHPTLSYALAGGRSAAAFAVLAGVGIAFMTGRARVPVGRDGTAAAASLAVRALAIGAIGLALGVTDAEIAGVILPYYAVLFGLAIPLVFLPTGALAAAGAAIAVAVPVLSHLLRSGLPEAHGDNPSIGYLLEDPLGLLLELSLTGFYPALPWVAYVFAGLVIGRLRLSSARVAAGLLTGGALLAVTAAAASWVALGPLGGGDQIKASAQAGGMSPAEVTDTLVFGAEGVTPTSTWWWLTTDAPHTSTPLDVLHTTGTAVALLGALLLFAHVTAPVPRAVVAAVLSPLAAAGAMTLTLYTGHILFLNSPLDDFDATTGYLLQVSAALAFAAAWSATMGRGPLERVVTTLAHRARRAVTAAPTDPADRPGHPQTPHRVPDRTSR